MVPYTNKEIVDQIGRQGSVHGAAKALQISWQTVVRARDGRRIERTARARGRDRQELCTCCGIRPRAEGNRWLCDWCFGFETCGEISPELRIIL